MARSRVELFEQIRRDERAGGLSIRELAAKHHVHRRTVRQALASPVPPPRKVYPPRPRPAVGAYAQVIDGWLVADQGVPRKQRHTARRVWQRLVAEHGATLAEVTVSRYVARRRAELGLDQIEVTVPQAHLPGAEAEVDFGEFHAMIAGALIKLWMFVMRLSCSGRAFHVAFATQAQEAFLEGHVLAFEYFGAAPGRVRPATIAAAFAAEQSAMLPLPAAPFDPARLLQARVDGRARVCVRQNYYSVPGPLHRPPPGGAPVRGRCRGAGGAAGGGPARAGRGQVRRDLGPRPLPASLEIQARGAAWRHRVRAGQSSRRVHRRSPAVLGRRSPGPRRRRRNPGADQGPARPPHAALQRAAVGQVCGIF